MKTPGMIRKMDELGRIVIPQGIRKALEMQSGDSVELCMEGDRLVIRKYTSTCVFCGSREQLLRFEEKHICQDCLQALRKV